MSLTKVKIEEMCARLEDMPEFFPEDISALSVIALSALDAQGGEAVATLHDDGCYTWRKGKEPNESRYAGWCMDVYTHPSPAAVQALREALESLRKEWAKISRGNGIMLTTESVMAAARIDAILKEQP